MFISGSILVLVAMLLATAFGYRSGKARGRAFAEDVAILRIDVMTDVAMAKLATLATMAEQVQVQLEDVLTMERKLSEHDS